MVKAVVYKSNAGHTKAYAELLGEKTGLPVYEVGDACKKLSAGTDIIFLGWLMAGKIKGYKKADRRFNIKALCGVGMAKNGSQITDVHKANTIPDNTPVFTLQGGFEIDKLHGVYKLMMNTMNKTVGKGLRNKENRTPEEDEMLELMLDGGSRVSEENLSEVIEWVIENR